MPYICLSHESYANLAEYADVVGLTPDHAASIAIESWWGHTGALSVQVRLEKGDKRKVRSRKPITISLPAIVTSEDKCPIRKAVNE